MKHQMGINNTQHFQTSYQFKCDSGFKPVNNSMYNITSKISYINAMCVYRDCFAMCENVDVQHGHFIHPKQNGDVLQIWQTRVC